MSISSSPISPTPAVPHDAEHVPGYAADDLDEDEEEGGFSKLWIGIGAGLLAILAALYYFLFIADDVGNRKGGTPTAAAPAKEAPVEAKKYYATGIANIRDAATTTDSNITAKLKRGEEVAGKLVAGAVEGEQWLELDDAKGFVSLINLTENEMPVLAKNLGRRSFTLAGGANLWDAPADGAQLLDRLSKGLTINASGITENGYAEIILRKGGVGYIADGEKLIADAAKAAMGPPIAIKLDSNGCATGPDVKALFKQVSARIAAKLKAIEDADYPDDAARDAAITKYELDAEGKSETLKIRRSFKGLSVTGVAQHYESRSIYFSDSTEKVREVFRSLGVTVGKDGQIPSKDIYAGIDSVHKNFRKYGQTDLSCGV